MWKVEGVLDGTGGVDTGEDPLGRAVAGVSTTVESQARDPFPSPP